VSADVRLIALGVVWPAGFIALGWLAVRTARRAVNNRKTKGTR
jgi:hypothetical protein